MKLRDCIIMGILAACVAVAGLVWYEVRTTGRMHEAVEAALEQNRNYEAFTTDSVLRRVVDYYDHPLRFWVSSNERLRAHYALGCAYRDLHEAPMALLSWEDAIACADTMSASCDFSTLFRVYGQMAEVYRRQYMPEKELEASQHYYKYALLSGDTLKYIRGLLLQNSAFLALKDTAAVYQNIEHVRSLYLERGLTQEAAQVYPSAIRVALDRGNFEKADSMMQIYEQESRLFDEKGNIAQTREIYYYNKGRYFLGIHQLDSAERQFRRLLHFQDNLVDAYRGLVAVYLSKFNKDSLVKYSTLHEDAVVCYLEDTQTDAVTQAKGMYDYSRQKQQAKAQKRKADTITIISVSVFILLLGIAAIFERKHRQNREQEERKLIKISADYSNAIKTLAIVKKEKNALQRSLQNKESAMGLLQEKAEQVNILEKEIQELKDKISSLKHGSVHNQQEAKVIELFHKISEPHFEEDSQGRRMKVGARRATETDWSQMQEMLPLCYPKFYVFIHEKGLSIFRLRLCILVRLGFDNKAIQTLLGININTVSNTRRSLAQELFGLSSAKDLDAHLKAL